MGARGRFWDLLPLTVPTAFTPAPGTGQLRAGSSPLLWTPSAAPPAPSLTVPCPSCHVCCAGRKAHLHTGWAGTSLPRPLLPSGYFTGCVGGIFSFCPPPQPYPHSRNGSSGSWTPQQDLARAERWCDQHLCLHGHLPPGG